MIKTFNITKKLSLRMYAHGFRSSFKFISIYIDRFIDYQLTFEFLNMRLSFYYENTEQQKALKRLHKTLGDMEE